MGGFFGLFKNIGKAADAHAQKAADAIEKEHAVEFGRQDITNMKNDLADVIGNIGTVKAEVVTLENKIKGLKADMKKHEDDAQALVDAGNDALAEKHCAEADLVEAQITSLAESLKIQKEVLTEQQSTKNEFEATVREAEADLTTMKAMKSASDVNKNLTKVSAGNGKSAVARFKERKEAMQKELVKSRAIKEATDGNDLEEETKKALGQSAGSSRLAKMKAKKK